MHVVCAVCVCCVCVCAVCVCCVCAVCVFVCVLCVSYVCVLCVLCAACVCECVHVGDSETCNIAGTLMHFSYHNCYIYFRTLKLLMNDNLFELCADNTMKRGLFLYSICVVT